MNAVDEKTGTVALLEATAEARALIEDLTRLSEELKLREERLGELLAPSEAALRARTEYLDKVTRDELSRAEQQVLKLAEEVSGIARRLKEEGLQMPARLAEADARRRSEGARHERLRMIVSVLVMLLGGFLAGQIASWRSGTVESARPAAIEPGTSASRIAPAAPRRTAGQRTKPTTKPAR
jgi:hypothetical protein